MTVRTRAELNSDADTHIEDNTTGNVTPADVRGRVKDLADSALLPEDIGTTVQGYSSNLAEWSGINPSANGGSLVAAADYAAMRALLDLEVGTDFLSPSAIAAAYQPLDSDLTAIASLTTTAGGRGLLTLSDPNADRIVFWDDSAGVFTHLTVGTGLTITTTTIALSSGAQASLALADTALQAAAIGVSVQAYDADTAKLDVENQALTGGATVTSKSLGTVSSGTLTLDMGDRPLQDYTANGAHTLAPGTTTGSCLLDVVNGASAGSRTLSGWTKVEGSFTNTNGHKFRCHCSVGTQGSLLIIQALQ